MRIAHRPGSNPGTHNWRLKDMERPILFSTAMVRAILEGRKTQTRRVVKSIYDIDSLATAQEWNLGRADERMVPYEKWGKKRGCGLFKSTDGTIFAQPCPYGAPGDLLWVRETFVLNYSDDIPIAFRADWHDGLKGIVEPPKWKPSIFMPKKYARIWLEITDVRVERVQNITESDAENEGMDGHCPEDRMTWDTPREQFTKLWDSINGKKYPWSGNPWVWVVEFQQIKKAEVNDE